MSGAFDWCLDHPWVFVFPLGALFALIVWASIAAEHDCENRGGVYHCTSSNGVAVTSKGAAPVYSTSCECYTRDGRLLLP